MNALPPRERSESGKGWRLNVTVLPSRYAVCKRDVPPTVEHTSGWRALRIAGQLDHAHASGVLLTAAEPLARAGIPIFPVTASASGFVFVREEHLARAIETLAQWGHQIRDIST